MQHEKLFELTEEEVSFVAGGEGSIMDPDGLEHGRMIEPNG